MTAASPWRRELEDLTRGAAGALLFGTPLLFTMEVWWLGAFTEPTEVFGLLVVAFLPVLLLIRTAGFRGTTDVRMVDAVVDTVQVVALSVLLAGGVLALLNRLTPSTPFDEVLATVVYEAIPLSLGAAVADQYLRETRTGEGRDDRRDRARQTARRGPLAATLTDIGATVIGAGFVASTIAPTEEIPMLTASLPPSRLLGVLAASLAISYVIVFAAGFAKESARRAQPGVLQHPLTETVVSYLAALAVSALMLWFFQNLGETAPAREQLARVLVLGLPASVGGAAGRLAV